MRLIKVNYPLKKKKKKIVASHCKGAVNSYHQNLKARVS